MYLLKAWTVGRFALYIKTNYYFRGDHFLCCKEQSMCRVSNKISFNVTAWKTESVWVLYSSLVSAVVVLHHCKKEGAKTRPGLVAVLLCQLLVGRLTGFARLGWRRWDVGPGRLLLVCTMKSEVSIPGSSPAHTCPDQRSPVLAQIPLLVQRPGNLLPVTFGVRAVLRTEWWLSNKVTAEALVVLLARDAEDEDAVTCRGPGALGLVFGDQFSLNGLCRGSFGLATNLQPRLFLVLSSVHPSSSSSVAPGAAAQHLLVANAGQNQKDGDIGEESHETNTKGPARG